MPNILWTTSYQTSGKIIRSAAALAGVPVELPADYKHYVDNKKPEFLSKFPNGKIPAFEQSDGFLLFESTTIARYVAGLAPNASLLGNDLKESALIDQWIHLAESELDGNTTVISNLLDGSLSPYNKSIHTTFTERERRVLKTLNDHLATRTFFVGERITLADIYVASQVRRAATVTFDAAARAEFNHLTRHLETIINQPKLKDIYEPNEFVEKALQYVSSAREKKSATSLLKAEKKTQPSENDEEEPDVPSRS